MFNLYGYFKYLYPRSSVKITQAEQGLMNGNSLGGPATPQKVGTLIPTPFYCSRVTEQRRLQGVLPQSFRATQTPGCIALELQSNADSRAQKAELSISVDETAFS